MGEAVYSLLAIFPKKITEKQQTTIKEFFLESFKAYEYWQDNRGDKKAQKDFWKEFKTQFPTMSEYLASLNLLDGGVNALSGNMDFGNEDYLDQICFDGREMTYSAEVWHFAHWEPLTNFMVKKFGATSADYLSDEDSPSGVELIRLMKNDGIIEALLGQDKKFLMTLIGIHPKLDAQIERLLKSSEKKEVA